MCRRARGSSAIRRASSEASMNRKGRDSAMARRQIPDDWCDIGVPENSLIHPTAYIVSSECFYPFRSEQPVGLEMAEGSGLYFGAMLDVGPRGRVRLGRC